MTHPITYDEWLAHLDDELAPEAAARVRRHIAACRQCRGTWDGLLDATSALRSASEEFVSAVVPRSGAVDRGRERVLARIRAVQSPTAIDRVAVGELTLGRLRRLQHVVAPACGAHTAFRLIMAAVGRTPAPHENKAWFRFLEELRDLTSALCGRSMARLVWEIGNSLP
jgi:anti-sigma factor RsiW